MSLCVAPLVNIVTIIISADLWEPAMVSKEKE